MPLQDNLSTAAAAPLQNSAPPQQLSLPEPSVRASKSARRPHSVSGSATVAASASNVAGTVPSKRASNSKQSQKQFQHQSPQILSQAHHSQLQAQRTQQILQAKQRAQIQTQQQHLPTLHPLQHARQLPQNQGSIVHSAPAQVQRIASQQRLHSTASSPPAVEPARTATLAAMASKSGAPQPQPQMNSTVAMNSPFQYRLNHQMNATRQQAGQQQTHPSQSHMQQDFALDAQTRLQNQYAFFHQSSHFAKQSSNPSSLLTNVAQIPNNTASPMDQAMNALSFRQPVPKHAPAVTETASTLSQPSFSAQQPLNPGVGAGPFIGAGLNVANGVKVEHMFPSHNATPAPVPTRPKPINERQFAAKSPIAKIIGVGQCVQQLMKLNEEQRHGQIKNSVEGYWKPFVKKYFTPDATICLDFKIPSSGNQIQNRTIELPVEVMPRIFKSKYDSGVSEDRLLLENPMEYLLENGTVIVDCPRTTMLTTYQNSKVCTDGYLRVSFTKEKKIISWEFATDSHEELFNRDSINKNHQLPNPVCTPYGIPASAFLLLTIAESVNAMMPSLDSQMEMFRHVEALAEPINRYKNPAHKDAQSIFKQMNDAALFPAGVVGKPKQNHSAALQNVDVLAPDFASAPAGLRPFGPDHQVTGTLQQPSQVIAQMQLQMHAHDQIQAQEQQMQAQEQQMQSDHLSLDPSPSRIHPNSIRTHQNNQISPEMFPGFRNDPGSSLPVHLRNAALPTTEGIYGHSVALQASLSGGIGAVSDVGSLFPDSSTPGVDHSGDGNASVLSQLKVASSVGAPSGLSLFAPTTGILMDVPVAKPVQDINVDMFGGVGNPGIASASNPSQVGGLEALDDAMFVDSSLYQLDQLQPSANGIPVGTSSHIQSNPNVVSSVGALASTVTASASQSPGNGGAKRSAAGSAANLSKRRRSVASPL